MSFPKQNAQTVRIHLQEKHPHLLEISVHPSLQHLLTSLLQTTHMETKYLECEYPGVNLLGGATRRFEHDESSNRETHRIAPTNGQQGYFQDVLHFLL